MNPKKLTIPSLPMVMSMLFGMQVTPHFPIILAANPVIQFEV